MQKDDLISQLNSTLRNFIDFFSETLQKKVLELDSNIKSDTYYKQLIRVSNSLEQYLKKDVNLFYIGFLGSYSSGKTSTINSLLEIWHTDKIRKVSNNPTDNCITLIANQTNVNSVFTFTKEGAVAIRTNTNFECEFLKNIVLMDTPGSGDPNIVESIVRDSLPLCDLIIYTLNATAPFTEIDRPFLIAQQSKLKDIPILFVLTRADEFRLNKKLEISNDNFDTKRYQTELETLIDRINESIKISDFKAEHFLIIDNYHQYNIVELKERIFNYTSNNNENLIVLHNHKLSYFRREIFEIQKYYLELASSKIDKCEKFILKAKNNIEHFNKQIEVSKIKFKHLWNDYTQKLDRVHDGVTKGYLENLINEINAIIKFSDTSEYQYHVEELHKQLRSFSENKANQILREIEEKTFERITIIKQNLINLINYENLIVIKTNSYEQSSITIDIAFPLNPNIVFIEIYNKYITLYNDDLKHINNIISQLSKSIKAAVPVDSLFENLTNYKIAILEILELYYEAVKMYNIAAFSYEVKNYISELGLAKEFDKIEAIEIDKNKYNSIAERVLLETLLNGITSFQKNLSNSTVKSEELVTTISSFIPFIYKNEAGNELTKLDFSYSSTFEESSIFINDLNRILINGIQDKLFVVQKSIKALTRKRIRNYLLGFTIPLISVVIINICIQKLSSISLPNSVGFVIISGILTSLVATIITRIFDNFKTKKHNTIEELKTVLYEENSIAIDEKYQEFKKNNITHQKEIANKIFSNWAETVDNIIQIVLTGPINEKEELVIKTKNEVDFILKDYRNKNTTLNKSLKNDLENHDINLVKIQEIALKIKEESIQPSFDLLVNTLTEIKSVKEEILELQLEQLK